MKKYSISAFFPVYNDAKTIPNLVSKIIPILKSKTNDYEIILVNDGSTDNSAEALETLAKKFKNVRTIHHKRNKGYGGALKTGFANAKKELIFYTDGDGQYDVTEFKKLLPFIDDVDIVNGYKIRRSDVLFRKIVGSLYRYLVNFLFNLKVKDVDCDFRLMKKKIFKNIKLESKSGFICVELMNKAHRLGFKVKDVPVHHFPRLEGRSQFFRPRKIVNVFSDLIEQWYKLYVRRWG